MSWAEDMGLDVEPLESVLNRNFRGYNYTKITDEGVTVHKGVNLGKELIGDLPVEGPNDFIMESETFYPHNKQKRMAKQESKEELLLPNDVTKVSSVWPRDLVVISIPKMGKGNIFGGLTKLQNAIVFDLEKGGYEFIEARKVSIYSSQETSKYEAFLNYIKWRNAFLKEKGKYDFLCIDGLTDLDEFSEIGGTMAYMTSIVGSKFNKEGGIKEGKPYQYGDFEWKSVLTLPDGAGYKWTREWFLAQIEFFRQISPYRVYAAHVLDKYIKENGKEEVIGSEINLTGKLKTIFASKVTALAKLIADGDERYLNFEVLNEGIIAGSRAPHLKGKILISKLQKNGQVNTYWENVYTK